jgi:multicomponent Na+:H+ antiporter subunit D
MEFLANLLPAGLMAHAPALVVVVPLVAAAIAAFMPNGKAGWAVAMVTATIVAVFSLALLGAVAGEGVISYAMGGW